MFLKNALVLLVMLILLTLDCIAQVDSFTPSLQLKLIKIDKNQLSLEFKVENKTDKTVYVTANPQYIDGASGYYISFVENRKSLLNIESRIFSSPPCFLYVDKRGVELKKLNPDQTYSDSIFINFPKKQTVPPYNNGCSDYRKINLKEVKQVELTIGYFFEDEGILDFLRRKPFGWFIQGEEQLSKGNYSNKSFLQLQKLLKSTIKL